MIFFVEVEELENDVLEWEKYDFMYEGEDSGEREGFVEELFRLESLNFFRLL